MISPVYVQMLHHNPKTQDGQCSYFTANVLPWLLVQFKIHSSQFHHLFFLPFLLLSQSSCPRHTASLPLWNTLHPPSHQAHTDLVAFQFWIHAGRAGCRAPQERWRGLRISNKASVCFWICFPLWLLLYLPSSGRLGNYNLIWRSHVGHVDDTHMWGPC